MNELTRRSHLVLMIGLIAVVAAPAQADWGAGVTAFSAGDYGTAAEHFKGVVKSNPNWSGGYLMLGRCELLQDNPSEAVEHLQIAYDLAPEKPEHVVALGRALLANEEPDRLLALLEQVDRSRFSRELGTETTLLEARAETAAGNPPRAVEVLRQALAQDSENAVLARALGLILKSGGDRPGAIEALARAWELDPRDVESARLAVSLALELAAACQGEERALSYQGALELAGALAAAAPTHEHQLLAGEAALGARDLEAAETWFAAAVASESGDPISLFYLGRTRAALDRDEEAMVDLRRALAASPDADLGRRIHDQLARLSACELDLTAAVEHYRMAGRSRQATQIEEVASSSRDALAALATLRSELAELRGLERQLRELGDEQGVAAVGERIALSEAEIRAIESNLHEVRTALCS